MDHRLRNFNPSRLSGPTPHTLAYDSSDTAKLWNKLQDCHTKATITKINGNKMYTYMMSIKLPATFLSLGTTRLHVLIANTSACRLYINHYDYQCHMLFCFGTYTAHENEQGGAGIRTSNDS